MCIRDRVIILPAEATASDPAVTKMADAGIHVIVVNSKTDSTDKVAVSYCGSDDVYAGELLAKWVIEQVPDGGKYAHCQGTVSYTHLSRPMVAGLLRNHGGGAQNIRDTASRSPWNQFFRSDARRRNAGQLLPAGAAGDPPLRRPFLQASGRDQGSAGNGEDPGVVHESGLYLSLIHISISAIIWPSSIRSAFTETLPTSFFWKKRTSAL